MPRETIYGADGFDVSIGWGREDEVQVASVAGDGEGGAAKLVETVNEWLKAAGMPTVDWDTLRKSPRVGPYFSGWTTFLKGRREVNDLIRLLQRARDGAFGKDA